jgi:hypothetical protein
VTCAAVHSRHGRAHVWGESASTRGAHVAEAARYTLRSAGRSCALSPAAADQVSSPADRTVRHCVEDPTILDEWSAMRTLARSGTRRPPTSVSRDPLRGAHRGQFYGLIPTIRPSGFCPRCRDSPGTSPFASGRTEIWDEPRLFGPHLRLVLRAFSAVNSPSNHAFAIFQSRLTVSGEIFRTSAVSSTLNPPK